MESKPVVSKQRYYSKVAGSKFIFPDGETVFFNHGFFDFDPANYPGPILLTAVNGQAPDKRDGRPKAEVYKEELDAIIKSNPLFYVQGGQPEALPRVGADANAKSEAEISQAEGILKNSGAQVRVTGDINSGSRLDVNESTVDPALQSQVLAPKRDRAAEAAARQAAGAAGTASHSSNS